MGLSRRTFLAGALSSTALAATGCAGTVAEPGDLSRLRITGSSAVNARPARPRHPARPGPARLRDAAVRLARRPAVIGLILGPVAETNLRQALAISDGGVSVLVGPPFSVVVLLVAVLAVVVPPVLRRVRRLREQEQGVAA